MKRVRFQKHIINVRYIVYNIHMTGVVSLIPKKISHLTLKLTSYIHWDSILHLLCLGVQIITSNAENVWFFKERLIHIVRISSSNFRSAAFNTEILLLFITLWMVYFPKCAFDRFVCKRHVRIISTYFWIHYRICVLSCRILVCIWQSFK